MAITEEDRPMDGAASRADMDSPPRRSHEKQHLKRRGSDSDEEKWPKRLRYEDEAHEPRRDSSPRRRDSHDDGARREPDRRKQSTQEEKKRSKRLFGGLLSTLSQTGGTSQQKRRMEIERRQQERMQKQQNEDDREKTEKLAHVTKTRMAKQIVFEEEVMRSRHTKMLSMASFLRTRSHPPIYYLPWKLTAEQEDTIKDQVREAEGDIEKELEDFAVRKAQHEAEHGRPGETEVQPKDEPAQLKDGEPAQPRPANEKEGPEVQAETENGREQSKEGIEKVDDRHQGHHHDESADVVEEAEEDMVIY